MKATIICGSANREGVTSAMCMCAKTVLEDRGYETNILYPSDMEIAHCRDCDGCRGGKCIIDDDMAGIYESYAGSDLLVLSTPIHFSGPSSLIKTVMDRFQPCWFHKGGKHPARCLAMMCGGSKEPNFDLTESIIRAFCITAGMEFGGSLRIPDTDSGAVDINGRVESFLAQSI